MRSGRIIIVICLISQFIGNQVAFSQDRRMIILEKFLDKRSRFTSISYTMMLEHKIFSREDTIFREANVELVRIPSDSIFGGSISIDFNDTLWFGYNGQSVFRASIDDSVLTVGNAIRYPGLYIKSTWVDNFIDYGFLKNGQGPKTFIEDPTIEKVYSDTMIEGRPCLGILFKLPDEGDFTKQKFFVAIDTFDAQRFKFQVGR